MSYYSKRKKISTNVVIPIPDKIGTKYGYNFKSIVYLFKQNIANFFNEILGICCSNTDVKVNPLLWVLSEATRLRGLERKVESLHKKNRKLSRNPAKRRTRREYRVRYDKMLLPRKSIRSYGTNFKNFIY